VDLGCAGISGFHDLCFLCRLEKNKDRVNRTEMLRYNTYVMSIEGGTFCSC